MRKRSYSRFILILLPLLVSHCTEKDDLFLEYLTDEGIKIVLSKNLENPPQPWKLIEHHVAGIAYGDSTYMLRNPVGVTVLISGEWIVVDSKPLEIRIYSSEGRFVNSFGEPGGGPNDLQWSSPLRHIRAVTEDQFELWSGWPLRIQTWSTEGNLLEVKLKEDHPFLKGRFPRQLEFIENQMITLTSSFIRNEENESIEHSYILKSDWEGSYIDTLFFIDHAPMSIMEGMAQAAFDYPPSDELLLTSDNRLFFSSWEEDWIHEIDLVSGGEKLRFRMEHEADSIPEYWIDKYRENFGKEMADGLARIRDRVWFIDMFEGPSGEIWIQRTGEPLEDNTWPSMRRPPLSRNSYFI